MTFGANNMLNLVPDWKKWTINSGPLWLVKEELHENFNFEGCFSLRFASSTLKYDKFLIIRMASIILFLFLAVWKLNKLPDIKAPPPRQGTSIFWSCCQTRPNHIQIVRQQSPSATNTTDTTQHTWEVCLWSDMQKNAAIILVLFKSIIWSYFRSLQVVFCFSLWRLWNFISCQTAKPLRHNNHPTPTTPPNILEKSVCDQKAPPFANSCSSNYANHYVFCTSFCDGENLDTTNLV